MRMGLKISVTNIDPEVWAKNNNGPWPEHDKNALNTAVRQDIRQEIVYRLQNIACFEELGIEVEVK